jgi:peptidyl-tRNA hydrolase, PTH1 family
MALFQKKPIVESSAPLYQLGLETTVLIVGLGNIGKEYAGTRHNIGFAVVDNFAEKQGFDQWISKKEFKSALTSKTIGSSRVILMKPTTFMNNSGEALQAVQHFYRVGSEKTLIAHDELAINFGQIRLRAGGSDAGNNGLKSIIQHGGENTKRMRIGIGPKKPAQIDSADFVLGKFNKAEEKQLPHLLQETTSILSEFAHGKGDLPHETRTFIL